MMTEAVFFMLVVLVSCGLCLLSEPVRAAEDAWLTAVEDESRPASPEPAGVTVWAEPEPGPKGVRGWVAGLRVTWIWPWKTRAEKAAAKGEAKKRQRTTGQILLNLLLLILSLVGFFFAAIGVILFFAALPR